MEVCDLLHTSMSVCLPYKYENERKCTFITAISKVDGSFSVFIEVQDFVMKLNFIMPLELWLVVKHNISIDNKTDMKWSCVMWI